VVRMSLPHPRSSLGSELGRLGRHVGIEGRTLWWEVLQRHEKSGFHIAV
jgi:hypothetical protein